MSSVGSVTESVRDSVPVQSFQSAEVVHYSIPAFDLHGGSVVQRGSEIESGKLAVARGDVLVSRLNPRKSRVQIVDKVGEWTLSSTEFVVLRPRAVDGRYLAYVLGSEPSRQLLDAEVRSVTRSQQRVHASVVRSVEIPETALIRQQAIADFLDRECARIAATTMTAARIVAVLAQQEREVFERLTLGAPTVALRRRLLRIEQGWSPECEATTAGPGEWGVLKVGCVNHGRFRAGEHKRLPDDLTPRPALEIRPGELLMSRANTRELVGSAAVIDDVDGRRLMLCDLLYRLRFGEAIRPGFLALALGSRPVRGQIEASAGGAAGSMPKVSQSIIRRLLIPDLPLAEQESIERAVAVRSTILAEATRGLTELQDRLAEYRDALITEAVTGQLAVTALSDAQMDERLHQRGAG